VKKNVLWVVCAAVFLGVLAFFSLRSVQAPKTGGPQEVRFEIETTVDVAPDGVAKMRSTIKFVSPEVLVTMMRDMSKERGLWLRGLFDDSYRASLREQPWEAGEVTTSFKTDDPKVFVVDSLVVLYRYAWVEKKTDQLWYSPGIVTRQEELVQLVNFLERLGQPVSRVVLLSRARAEWPAGSRIVETMPIPGPYGATSGKVSIQYELAVERGDGQSRPIVAGVFNIEAASVDAALKSDLSSAFDTLLKRAGVPLDTRNVFIRYTYPVPAELAEGREAMRGYKGGPRRGAAISSFTALAGSFLGFMGVRAWYRRRERQRAEAAK
jgi:hypothetical protein